MQREVEERARDLAKDNRVNWCVHKDKDTGAFEIASAYLSAVRGLSRSMDLVCWYEADGTRRTKDDGVAWWYVRVEYEGWGSTGSRLHLYRTTAVDALDRAERQWNESDYSDGKVRTGITVWPASEGRKPGSEA